MQNHLNFIWSFLKRKIHIQNIEYLSQDPIKLLYRIEITLCFARNLFLKCSVRRGFNGILLWDIFFSTLCIIAEFWLYLKKPVKFVHILVIKVEIKLIYREMDRWLKRFEMFRIQWPAFFRISSSLIIPSIQQNGLIQQLWAKQKIATKNRSLNLRIPWIMWWY